MKGKFYKMEDCDVCTTTSETILRTIWKKVYSFKRENNNSPLFVILDKKTYKQLNKEVTMDYRDYYLAGVFGIEIKVVKSKEQLICVGL